MRYLVLYSFGLLLGGAACSGAVFAVAPSQDTQRDSIPVEAEIALIEAAAKLPDVQTRVRRLFWHVINHNSSDGMLHEFAADRLFTPENEAWLTEELQRLAAAMVEKQNLFFWTSGHWRAASLHITEIPPEISYGKSEEERLTHLEEKREALRKREVEYGYSEYGPESPFGEVVSFLGSVRRDETVRVIAPLLFYECRIWDMGDVSATTPADSAIRSLIRINPRGMPRFSSTRALKERRYNYVHELQNWWIAHAHEFGAKPPPPELVIASRRLHEPAPEPGPSAPAAAFGSASDRAPHSENVRRAWIGALFLAIATGLFLFVLRRRRA